MQQQQQQQKTKRDVKKICAGKFFPFGFFIRVVYFHTLFGDFAAKIERKTRFKHNFDDMFFHEAKLKCDFVKF